MKKLIKGAMAGAVVMMLAGCQLYNEALKPDRQEERYIQATRKGEILNGLKTEAVIVATRLNEFDPEQFKSSEGEYFFIDIYISDDAREPKDRGLNNPLYSLRLSNGSEPIEIKRVEREELLKRNITFASRWGEYFLVKFEPQERRYLDRIKLELVHKNLGITVLDYGFRNIKAE
ncbi:hypothetical protein [Wolinella succinogenes]|uniref:hypothetical protein n=1 Tax=Wolinella succinogenes TaxID=844 RepID=UPI00240A2847|nr:hypothetical protein [Wolinella succinogenes]